MNWKLFSSAVVCLVTFFVTMPIAHAQEKITGPWLWMIAPTEPDQGGAASIDIDSLAVASGGAVTESEVAANGAREGDKVGNYAWTLGQISATGGDNINECLNRIGMAARYVDDHSSYALFTFKSDTVLNGTTMHVGSDDAIKVWLNGEVVHTNPVNRGASGFQEAFPVNLAAGNNLLMVKVSERSGGWSMFVGIDTVSVDDGIDTVSVDDGIDTVSVDDGQIQGPDIGHPIVQVVYRSMPGSPPRPNVDAEIDGLIKKTQLFFADEMERHGFGRKTFQIEVDTSGNTVVHRGQVGIPRKNIVAYMEEVDLSTRGACGIGGASRSEGHAGFAHIYCWDWLTIAHELGHAFGLHHDFRTGSDNYIMSYGFKLRPQLSHCTATWLDTHRAFNPAQSTANEPTTIEMLPPSLDSPPNAIRLRFKVTDPDGLHQVQLLTPTITPGIAYGAPELLSYKALNGSTNATVEFVTDLTPNNESVSLMVIDVHGNFTWNLHRFPINVTSLLPSAKVVPIPDANLAIAVRQTLRLSSSQAITTHSILNLRALDAHNSGITDLTGLEHAHNLRQLNLGGEHIEGKGYVNSNTVSDLSPLTGLTKLTALNLSYTTLADVSALSSLIYITRLNLDGNTISDVSPLSELTQLTELFLSNNNASDISELSGLTYITRLNLDGNTISDVSPLSGLTNLTSLGLNNNTISDISVLSGLTQLTWLFLSNNTISDVSALSGLTQLTLLWLHNNTISDVSALVKLNLTGLYLWNNPLSYTSINIHIPAMQANGVEVQYDQRTPTKLLKISGDRQQAVINVELPLPFVIEVQDQYNRAFSEVPVTFSIIKGSGKLSTLTTTTDAKGKAKARFTLGQTEGETTIHVTAAKISQPIQFTVTAILPTSFVQLLDTNLTAKIAETLGKPANAHITVAEMLTLTSLTANNISISNLTGLPHASNLTTLRLNSNNLSNIDLLMGLTQLTTLSLDNNNLSNIAPLVELTQLETLSLENNKLSDVAPLLELTELKTLRLRGNLLSYPSLYTIIPTLRSRGVDVVVDTRTPTTLINIPGPPGVAGTARQVIVQVQDQKGVAFAGVPVNFTLTAADGHSSTSKAISNFNGKAATTLTLGPKSGKNTVSATVTEIPQPLNFTITTIDANTLVHIPDVNLQAKIAEILGKPMGVQLTAGDMLALTWLRAPNANIQNITGLEHAHNLRNLNLDSNTIPDFSPITGLTQLTHLDLSACAISDVSFLSSMTQLERLRLYNNSISDISALSGLTHLTSLDLSNNPMSDVSALAGLTQLETLYLFNISVSDVSPLAGLTQLRELYFYNTSVSDLSALSGLTQLSVLSIWGTSISDVSPLAQLTHLTRLDLSHSAISDISPLSGLTQLTSLSLSDNVISDISPLSGLTQLKVLGLSYNAILDVSPLVGLDLPGTQWNSTGLYIERNPLNYASVYTHIPAMQAKGIEVKFDNRAHSALVRISGDTQESEVGTTLATPFVIAALNEHGVVITGLYVTFRVIKGEGNLSATTATTDADGKAQTTLILGPNPGVIKVRVTAAGITYPVTFTATAVEALTRIAEDINGDGVIDVHDLRLVLDNFEQIGQNSADVNGDGIVNLQDLLLVAAVFEEDTASPPLHPSKYLKGITTAELQRLLTQARQMTLTDPAYLRGIAVLEQLLVLLLPKETVLLPNYPNPFNPETWIPYQLVKPVEVMLTIYTVDGSMVRTLDMGHQAAGTYQGKNRAAYWDGRNQQGERVASGIYFYTFKAGDFTATRKMLIRK